jgi:hypothetical protein
MYRLGINGHLHNLLGSLHLYDQNQPNLFPINVKIFIGKTIYRIGGMKVLENRNKHYIRRKRKCTQSHSRDGDNLPQPVR